MRAIPLALLFCVPLLASDGMSLSRAVEMFRSDDADVREDGSRQARRILERDLAALITAMDDDDAEVRRRARDAILSMIPSHLPLDLAEQDPTSDPWGGPVIVLGGRMRNRRNFRIVNGGQFVMEQDDEAGTRAQQLLGADGAPVEDPTLRAQLRLAQGRGYVLMNVDAEGRAAKFGLKDHDVVTRVNRRPVKSAAELIAALGESPDWDQVCFEFIRDGRPCRATAQATARD